ncbi:MAG: hypothetical protein M3N16_04400 [Actinomycetota bacterium]|nr:hypothetical protein [Actinomycetota bacterium]
MAFLRPRSAVLAAALVGAVGLAGSAGPALADATPWATINVCDTPHHPNALGVRASMPGNGTHQRMYMRFVVQYLDARRWEFVDLGGALRSRWILAGSARFRRREAGYTFRLNPPPDGRSYVLRARAELQWRRRRGRRFVVVRRARAITEADRATAAGADPPGFSAATCQLR